MAPQTAAAPLSSRWLYAQPYYVLNGIVCASWLLWRSVLPGAEWVIEEGSGSVFATREKEVCMLVGFALMSKVRRASSTHEFLAKCFLYGKVGLACLCYSASVASVALCGAVYAALFALVPVPRFAGAEHVEVLDGDSFARTAARRGDPDKYAPVTVVLLTASWHDGCTAVEPLFCSLAAQYASSRRKFAKIDVAAHAHVAKRYGVDLGVRSKQLPTFALFYAGDLQRRLPYFDESKPDAVVATRYTRASLESFFLLKTQPKDVVAKLKKIKRDQDRAAAAAPPPKKGA